MSGIVKFNSLVLLYRPNTFYLWVKTETMRIKDKYHKKDRNTKFLNLMGVTLLLMTLVKLLINMID